MIDQFKQPALDTVTRGWLAGSGDLPFQTGQSIQSLRNLVLRGHAKCGHEPRSSRPVSGCVPLERVMRDQPEKSEDTPPPKSVEDIQQALRERGLPEHIYTRAEFAKKR